MKNRKKLFAFVNESAEREYKALPEAIQDDLGKALRCVQFDEKPALSIDHLHGMSGVVELRINGSPAYRCVYTVKYMDTVVVLHTFEKTCNGPDKPAMALVRKRLKELESEV